MKKVLTLVVSLLLALIPSFGQKIDSVFVFHQVTFLETTTEKVLAEYSDMKGTIVFAKSPGGNEFIMIDIPSSITYTLLIVNTVIDTPEANLRIIMKQGGETIEGVGSYTANVFFVYMCSSESTHLELVRLAINGSPNVIEFRGLIRLNDSEFD